MRGTEVKNEARVKGVNYSSSCPKWLGILLSFLWLNTSAQTDTLSLEFRALFEEKSIVMPSEGACQSAPCIDSFKFFCGGIKFLHQDEVVYTDSVAYHLVDAEDPSSMIVHFPMKKPWVFDSIELCIGVDSITSAEAKFGGDLDPTTGMYWTWNSGYIHFRVEGQMEGPDDALQSFEYHLGGYSAPHSTFRELSFSCQSGSSILIDIDLDKFLKRASIAGDYRVMSEGADASRLADEFQHIFRQGHAH